MGPDASVKKRERVKQRVNRFLLRVANTLTLARLCATPLLVLLLLQTPENPMFDWFALGLIVVLQLSDVLDGYLARQAQGKLRVNPTGEILDPIADKLYINSAYITLMLIGRVPIWLGLLIVTRDVLILGGWVLKYFRSGVRIMPNVWGKAADSVQALLLVLILLNPPAVALQSFMWLAAGLTVISGFAYFRVALTPPREARP